MRRRANLVAETVAVDLVDLALARWQDDERVVHTEVLPARPARTGALSVALPTAVEDALGVADLWTHQAEGLDLVRAGTSVVLATPTASGKSLVYQAATAEAASQTPQGTTLALFPTKALGHDQLRSLHRLELPGVVAATYDGDTDPTERAWVRRRANVLLTNPEMLHQGILPFHGRWAPFLRRLRYVVLDELHVYRGVFGSHLAHLMRRLRRVCAHYGSTPTFVCASATIGDPGRLASMITGLDVVPVVDDGSPGGERVMALWNPPERADGDGRRLSAHGQTAELVGDLVDIGLRTIAFCGSRRTTETVAADIRRRLGRERAGLVMPYRAGYLPSERRAIEDRLVDGSLQAVIATSALELGVDIGGLDACVLDGFPGTIASMWQQVGRAGRSRQRSLAVLVAGADQLDQWLMAHPLEVFRRPPEPVVVNPSNPFIALPHLACAAYEQPLRPDEPWWGDDLDDHVRDLVQGDHLRLRDGKAFYDGRGSPASRIGLRTGSSGELRIVDQDGSLVGTVDAQRAPELVHPGATYLHRGQAYEVTVLDLDDRVAFVEMADGTVVTQVRTDIDIAVDELSASRPVGRSRLALGTVIVTEQVTGYERRLVGHPESAEVFDLDLPPTRLVTRAFWYLIDPSVLDDAGLARGRWPGALHAAEHAGIGMLPLFTICDRWDVGGVSTAHQSDTGGPTIFVYDGYPGGAGVAELGYEAGEDHLRATVEAVMACECADGCPSCVQSPKCGNGNEPLDKRGAVALLRAVLR